MFGDNIIAEVVADKQSSLQLLVMENCDIADSCTVPQTVRYLYLNIRSVLPQAYSPYRIQEIEGGVSCPCMLELIVSVTCATNNTTSAASHMLKVMPYEMHCLSRIS